MTWPEFPKRKKLLYFCSADGGSSDLTTAPNQAHGHACALEAQDHETLRGEADLRSYEMAREVKNDQEVDLEQDQELIS